MRMMRFKATIDIEIITPDHDRVLTPCDKGKVLSHLLESIGNLSLTWCNSCENAEACNCDEYSRHIMWADVILNSASVNDD